MTRPAVRVRDVRDGVLLADFPEATDEQSNHACVALAERLGSARIDGLLDAVPAARSLLAVFDPSRCSRERLAAAVEAARAKDSPRPVAHRRLVLPVAYVGCDLDELARAAGIPPEEFARRHSEAEYRVAFLGFAPGFAYLTGLPPELAAARLARPRPRVPAGAVAIGGSYTGIYPSRSPGGWRLIGQTAVRLFDPESRPPSLLSAGDRVAFEAVRLEDLPAPAHPRRLALRGAGVLRVLTAGLATTVQGGAAHGFAASGVPPGGAMDPDALARANARVGNSPRAPGLEIALVGPELEALADCVVAFAGEIGAECNGTSAPVDAPIPLRGGDRLRTGRMRRGAWSYLAVRGGVEPQSSCAPQPRLAANDVLAAGSGRELDGQRAIAPRQTTRELLLRVLPGPEADQFAPRERDRFFESRWRVSAESDRRGLRLEGPEPLAHAADPEIPPSGTVPGSIQVPGNGLPIVLGPDGPVTGGYPRIATVIGADVALLGRAAPGALLRFAPVTLEQALDVRRSSVLGVP